VQKICLLTTGQPTTNPRLVKEADALVEAGYDVQVIAAYWAQWASSMDDELIRSRKWPCRYVGGDPEREPLKYFWTRARHGLANRLWNMRPDSDYFDHLTVSRVAPDLITVARETEAALYIGHNLGALPAAAIAASANKRKFGFDVEDFHSEELPNRNGDSARNALPRRIEAKYLPKCDYITASSSGIATAYAAVYSLPRPEIVWNVFPIAERPKQQRVHDISNPLRLYWFSQTIGASRGLEDIVSAMATIPDGTVELHIRGVWQTGYESQLSTFAMNKGLNWNRVKIHSPAPASEMARLAAEYDVGLALEPPVSLNRQLCVSNKIFTYLLAGNAVLATATSGQQEILDQIGGAGASYKPGDVKELASLLLHWCVDRTSLQRAMAASWDCGTNEFNWDRQKTRFLSVVESTLRRS
jgi:glycosyltransferase involved in cell wall biosynthesis